MIIHLLASALAGIVSTNMRCPDGASLVGARPPEGRLIYCQKQMPTGDFVRHGPLEEYDAAGNLVVAATYNEGAPDGAFVVYYSSEESLGRRAKRDVAERGLFKKGKRVGVWRLYYGGGKVRTEVPFTDGEMDGNVKTWAANGRLVVDLHFKQGLQHGRQRAWYDNGSPRADIEFVDGKPHGVCMTWHKSGEIMDHGSFVGGKADGKWFHRLKNELVVGGFVEQTGHYSDGRRRGPWIVPSSGDEMYVWTFQNGTQDGACEVWRENVRVEEVEVVQGNPYTTGTRQVAVKVACPNVAFYPPERVLREVEVRLPTR